LRASVGDTLVVGDDLTATNAGRIALAAQKNAINAVIIKPNQAGTVSETIDAVAATRALGWKAIASHRSGETPDTWIADIAVGLLCGYIKAGAPTKPERTAKYTRLMEIESKLA
jgi:enolase